MTASSVTVEPGSIFRAGFPFVRETYTEYDEDGPCDRLSWKPGTRVENSGPEDTKLVADGVGSIVLTVVSLHQPSPRYPTRVFFVRQWVSPDGRKFGKTRCRMTTVQAFKRLANGYRFPFEIETLPSPPTSLPQPNETEDSTS